MSAVGICLAPTAMWATSTLSDDSRPSAMAIGSAGGVICGSTAPLVATFLMDRGGSFYVICYGCLLSLFCLYCVS